MPQWRELILLTEHGRIYPSLTQPDQG